MDSLEEKIDGEVVVDDFEAPKSDAMRNFMQMLDAKTKSSKFSPRGCPLGMRLNECKALLHE